MKTVKFIIAALMFLSLTNVNAQTKDPSAQHKKLLDIVGRWTVQGMEDRFLEVCDMYQGEYFIVCNSEMKTKSGGVNKGVSIIGFSMDGKHLTYYHYGSKGESQSLRGFIEENGTLNFAGEDSVKGQLIKTRVVMKKDGRNYAFKEETSVDGAPWAVSADMNYKRL